MILWMIFGSKLLSSFFIVSHLRYLFLKCLWHRRIQRSRYVTFKTHSSSLARLCVTHWPWSTFVWVSTNTLETTGLDQLHYNRCVKLQRHLFLNFSEE